MERAASALTCAHALRTCAGQGSFHLASGGGPTGSFATVRPLMMSCLPAGRGGFRGGRGGGGGGDHKPQGKKTKFE